MSRKYEHILKERKRGGGNTLERVLATLRLENVCESDLNFYGETFSTI